MRTTLPIPILGMLCCMLPWQPAHADDALYRCESADGGVSVQSQPCPKGVTQRKIPFERPSAPATPAVPVQAPAPAPVPTIAGHPVTPPRAIQGPNDPYPLWQCMRADGSTFDSRDGVPGRQWVAKTKPGSESEDDPASASQDPGTESNAAKLAERLRKGEHFVRPIDAAAPVDPSAATDRNAPPTGAAPGQWVADQCIQLEPAQACDRFAARRDSLRKQIYAAKPSERAQFGPEEQDLTSMLYAACGK